MTSTSDNTNSVDNAVARGIEYLRRIVADMEEWGDEEAFVYFQHRPDLDPFEIHDAEGNIRGRLAKGEADIIAHFRECREVPELIVVDGNQDHCKVKAHQRRREQEQRRREQLSDEATIQEVVRREPFSSMPWSGAGCMEEDVYMPATMVRTRECSGIAELDQWLMPLRDALTREAVLAELDNVTAAHSLFSWCRCKSIDTQDRMLQSLVQKVSIPRIGAENPWDALCFEHRCSCSKVASAAALVVAARRYPDAGIVPDVVARATDFLHNSQDKDGSWPVSSGGKCSDYLVGIL